MIVATRFRRWTKFVWRHTAPTNAVRVTVLCLAFGTLIAVGVSHVWKPAPMPAIQLDTTAGGDPVARFTETRVGHLLFAPVGGDNCRRVLFDNTTGAFREAGEIYCGPPPSRASEATSANRLQALSKSFQK